MMSEPRMFKYTRTFRVIRRVPLELWFQVASQLNDRDFYSLILSSVPGGVKTVAMARERTLSTFRLEEFTLDRVLAAQHMGRNRILSYYAFSQTFLSGLDSFSSSTNWDMIQDQLLPNSPKLWHVAAFETAKHCTRAELRTYCPLHRVNCECGPCYLKDILLHCMAGDNWKLPRMRFFMNQQSPRAVRLGRRSHSEVEVFLVELIERPDYGRLNTI